MDGKVVIDVELGTKSFEEQIKQTEEYLARLQRSYDKAMNQKSKYKSNEEAMANLRQEIEKTNNKLIDLKTRQEKLNMTDLSNAKASINDIGNSITGVIKKIGKWALAVFGIRTAYMFVRQAMSTLSQYNEQLATNVEYIRFALATTLQPVIEAIIKLVYQLLGLINSVAKSLFGVDLFANASADAFKKANKGAKELKKTLAGFDKLNVLNENGTTGSAGAVSPSIDLSQMGDADLSGTIRLLDRIKELFDKGLDTIVGNVKKVLIDLGASPEFISAWEKTVESFKKTFEGVIDFIVGLVKMLVGLLTGDTDLVVEGAKQAVTGIKNFIVGLFNTIVNIKNLAVTAIKDGFKAIGDFIYDKVIKPVKEWFVNLADNMTTSISNGVKNINNWFAKIPEKLNEIKNKTVQIFKTIATTVSTSIGDAFKKVINAVLARAEVVLNKPIATINSLVSKINGIPGINLGKLSTITLPRLAKGGILNMPGRGVDYYGAANIGERGREGVVPLDNEASLRIIGETIAKHTKFNADITLELEGRILARVMEEINANRSFARNGG